MTTPRRTKSQRKGLINPLPWQVAKFAEAILAGKQHQEAALAAGYSASNAGAAATALMKRGDVQEALTKGALDVQARGRLTNIDLLIALESQATLDFTEVYEADGKTFRNPKHWPLHIRRAVRELEFGVGGRVEKVKFEPRQKAIELLMRHMGMLKDLTIEHVITDARLSKMSDAELLAQVEKDTETYRKHVEARDKLRLAAATTPVSEGE